MLLVSLQGGNCGPFIDPLWVILCFMKWSFFGFWDPVGDAKDSGFSSFCLEELVWEIPVKYLKYGSRIWACYMWLLWHEHITHTFEDNERPLDLLKFLLFGTLFQWARIWGFTQCISIYDFLQSASFSSWVICICFISECLLSWTQCSSISIKFLSPKKKKNIIYFNKIPITY